MVDHCPKHDDSAPQRLRGGVREDRRPGLHGVAVLQAPGCQPGWRRLLGIVLFLLGMGVPACGQSPAPRPLRVVMDDNDPPFAFRDVDRKVQGILVDPWGLWERRTGRRVEIRAMGWGEGLRRMRAGEFGVTDTKPYGTTLSSRPYLRYLGVATVSVLALVVGLVVWNLALKRLVSRRTAALREGESRLRHLNRTLRMVSECNQTLARAADEKKLLNAICRLLVEHGGYAIAWVGLAEHDEAGSMRLAAQAGVESNGPDAAHRTWADTERGPAVTAVRTRQPILTHDLAASQSPDPCDQAARERGCVASAALPLTREDVVLGVLRVWATDAETLDAGEVALLTELAGDIAYGLTILRARAEHAHAEAARQAAHQRLADIIEFLPDATFVIDQDKRVIAWNHACEAMTGVQAQTLLGQGDRAYGEPFAGARRPILIDLLDQPAPEIEATYKYLQRQGHKIFGESFVPHLRGGQGAHLWAVASPLFDRDGRRCGAIEVIRDVTEQRRVEQALQDSGLKHRMLFETANDAILLMSRERFVDCNARSLTMFGCTREQIIGAPPYAFSPPAQPDGRPSMEKALQMIHLALTEGPRSFEWEHCRKDGTPFAAEVSLNPLQFGGETLLQAIVRDVTGRKQAEEVVRQLNVSLERRVAQRTAELAVAKDRAEEADRLKSAFLATMSHELRTPLNSVIGFTGILLQSLAGPLNEEQRKQLQMVQGSARHLLALINDVLDISKIEAGQIEIYPAPFNLREAIQEVAHTVEPLARNKGLTLTLQVAPDVGAVTSDRRRVEQVLLNLLSNAIKFTEQGSVTLRADCVAATLALPGQVQPMARPPAFVVSVADTGIGIKLADVPKLFQPFRQIDSGLTRLREGTGLGLAICRRLAERLGGEIRVESRWGQGSTFTLILPLVSHEGVVQPSPAPPPPIFDRAPKGES